MIKIFFFKAKSKKKPSLDDKLIIHGDNLHGTCHYEGIEKYKGKQKKTEIDIGLKKGLYKLIKKRNQHIVARLRRVDEVGSTTNKVDRGQKVSSD